jgi:3-hydroxyisobutyrate dehydrogenase-like beta-hydroxyacid dehydrogenase
VTALGFVGLGHLGGNMAVRFLGGGYTVYGETRHRGEVQDLEREGLAWRDTPREIAEAADVLLTSVPTDSVLEEVASGSDGILAGLAVGKVWVDMSTVSPHVSRDLAQRVRNAGLRCSTHRCREAFRRCRAGR